MSNLIEKRLIAKATHLGFPVSANFELTPVCNFNCDMCYVRTSYDKVKSLGGLTSVDSWLKIAEELKSLGCVFVLLTGGEPLTFPGFSLLYSRLSEMGFIITINTNATLIDDEIINIFKKYPPRRVNITLYGFSVESYKSLCHNSDGYNKAIAGLKLLKDNNIDIKLNLDVTKKINPEVNQILEFADKNNLPIAVNSYMFPFCRFHCYGERTPKEERVNELTASEYWIEFEKRLHKENFINSMKAKLESVKDKEVQQKDCVMDCRGGQSSLWITWDFNMAPCALMDSPHINLNEHSVSQAWEMTKESVKTLQPIEVCKGCKIKSFCPSCYASVKAELQACGNTDYVCKLSQYNYNRALSLVGNNN